MTGDEGVASLEIAIRASTPPSQAVRLRSRKAAPRRRLRLTASQTGIQQRHEPASAPNSDPVPFIDIAAQRRRLGTTIDDAVARVLTHCQFINGPKCAQFEAELAAFCGAKHVVGLRQRHRCAGAGADGAEASARATR